MEYLMEYGLFLAKAVTIVIAVGLVIGMAAAVGGRGRRDEQRGQLRVRLLNAHFNGVRDAMRAAVLDKADLKRLQREERKRAKAARRRSKRNPDGNAQGGASVPEHEGEAQASRKGASESGEASAERWFWGNRAASAEGAAAAAGSSKAAVSATVSRPAERVAAQGAGVAGSPGETTGEKVAGEQAPMAAGQVADQGAGAAESPGEMSGEQAPVTAGRVADQGAGAAESPGETTGAKVAGGQMPVAVGQVADQGAGATESPGETTGEKVAGEQAPVTAGQVADQGAGAAGSPGETTGEQTTGEQAPVAAEPAADDGAADAGEPAGRRVFVINFVGNLAADGVRCLREEVTAILSMAREQDEVVCRLESPGGLVHAYGLAAAQLQRLKNGNVPLTVCVDKVAASGGYLMACLADRLVAAPFALIGSIGVLIQMPNFHRVLKKHDIDYEMLSAGEFKRTLSTFGEITAKGREKAQEDVDTVHHLFKDWVKGHRPGIDIDRIATGETWLGSEAKERGLVDHIATSDECLLAACGQAEVFEVSYEFKKSLQDRLGDLTEAVIARVIAALTARSGAEDIR